MWVNNIPASIRALFLHADGSVAASDDQDLGGNLLKNVGVAEDPTDALTQEAADELYHPLATEAEAIEDTTGGPATTDTDVEARAAIDDILAVLRANGLVASS